MRSKKDNFQDTGPFHITNIDWNDANHRRSIMASLLRGVEVLECERQQKNEGTEAQDSAWWKHFHFDLHKLLMSKGDDNTPSHIFGAIFEFMSPTEDRPDEVPRFVIALRGTLLKRDTLYPDMKKNYHIFNNNLDKVHQSFRYQLALDCVKEKVCLAKDKKVWLAGYSLGAAITLLIGKEMARQGFFLETYLFNPPFVSLSLEWMKSRKLKLMANITRTSTRGIFAIIKSKVGDLKAGSNESEGYNYDPFVAIKDWEPHLFLNSNDFICSSYIGYFETRKVMRKWKKLSDLEKLATQGTLIRGSLKGECDKKQEPIHLLASAKLTINETNYMEAHKIHTINETNYMGAHKIQQWWNPQLDFMYESYQY